MKTVTIELPIERAEKVLWAAANEAALYGALLDYTGRRTYYLPVGGEGFDKAREDWREKYLSARRVIRAFDVEPEQTTEAETVERIFPHMRGQKARFNTFPVLGRVRVLSGGVVDKRRPEVGYRGSRHRTACVSAANRVVEKWRLQTADLDKAVDKGQ